ncbi:AVN_HP_G0028460.mRNA.1.CDS.1 [Saccharomyces cerevisiae]|nr:AVN_HP_G0028460.mRNA.1.CDS.1 [Saccharomyces cerevisiae]CAI5006392.1 ANL_HP_G0059620.mRNA.1.CDS.1 [Saccharomyces cerevisiae]CAI5031188.1 ANL_HP_G0080680.mRNA.1.CDS.1 [Saccharomyces cerevisiae]CAI6817981.1 AVN_HP_G0028460.mRNA.1.CDS.1 [Saccharomyces cerevisiae]CAI6923062.1 ANL_HP_G0059620.mRNA.1.CDS.1 [Saccharomyces cerevisiae]
MSVVPENTKIKKRVLNDRRTLYVGNLPKNCRKQDLRDLFEPNYGKITINMLKKKPLKKPLKRFAFIEFQEGVNLKKVKEKMNGKIFMNEKIVIENILTREEKSFEKNQKSNKKKLLLI